MADVTILVPVGPGDRPFFLTTLSSISADIDDRASVLCVFDGSRPTDAERMALSEMHARVLEIDKTPVLAEVLNRGLMLVTTEFVARVDADDVWLAGRLNEQLMEMKSNPDCIGCSANALLLDSNGESVGSYSTGSRPRFRRRLLVRNCVIHPSVMLRVDAVRAVGGYPLVSRVEDYALWLLLTVQGPWRHIARDLIGYRIHDGQLTRAKVTSDEARVIQSARSQAASALGVPRVIVKILDVAWLMAQRHSDSSLRRFWTYARIRR